MSSLISPDEYHAGHAARKTAPAVSSSISSNGSQNQNSGGSWPQGYAPGPGRFQSGGGGRYTPGHNKGFGGGVKKKSKKGNAFLHLENFTSVQQLALFDPSIEIITQQLKPNSPYFRASCLYQGQNVAAVQKTKKKAKQALCTKVIKEFKLLDLYRGAGASESLSVGIHTPELPAVEWMDDDVNAKANSDFTSFGNPNIEGSALSEALKMESPPGGAAEHSKAPLISRIPLGGGTLQTEKTKLAPIQNSNQKTPISMLYEVFTKEYVTFKEVSAGSNAGTVAGIQSGIDERVPNNHTGFACILSLPDGTQWLGLGRNKKSAQHDAAAKCLKDLKNINLPLPEGAGLQTVGGTLGGRQNDQSLKSGSKTDVPMNQPEDGDVGQMCFLKKLNELHPGLNEEYRTEGDHKNQIFIAFAKVNGTLFEGKGRAKKQAKKDLAMRILRQVHNFDLKVGQSAQEIVQSEEFTTNGIFADKISDAVNDRFYKLCEQQPSGEFHKMKVLAGICMTREPISDSSNEKPEVISLGTGTKMLTGENFTASGTALLDCHGEIIARRGFKRFLFDQVKNVNGLKQNGSDSIFFRPEGSSLLKLKPNIRFHLYINTSTCGDARIFNPNDKNDLADEHRDRSSRGILRTKIENGEGTVPIKPDRSELTWDGILGGGRILTMSCSDKVMRWNVLGLQGSLLSLLVEPIYLSSVVLGMLYHNDHFKRAMFSRLDKCSDLDFKSDPSTNLYKIARPMLAPTLTQTDRRAKNAPDFSVNWSILDAPNAMEMVNTSSGLRSSDRMPSRLSKTRLLDSFIETIRQLENSNQIPKSDFVTNVLSGKLSYNQIKSKSEPYQKIKNQLYVSMKKSGVGIWVKKPEEIEDFFPKRSSVKTEDGTKFEMKMEHY